MPGDLSSWGTTEWEIHVQRLLKRKYGKTPGTYQHIPSETHGDHGLEGFSLDGVGYQCYSAQDWSSPKDLYEKQRDKITKDLGTFISKELELIKLFGGVRINVWNLVVPYWKNKELIKHAKKKESFVRSLGLKHVAEDFTVSVITGEDFAIEAQELANAGLNAFNPPLQNVSDEELKDWLANAKNNELIDHLNRKSNLIGAGRPHTIEKFRIRIVKNYIGGSIVLKKLENDLPETYKSVLELKQQQEDDLDTETVTRASVPSEFFQETLDKYRSQLASSQKSVTTIANEAVADWLLRCPLDF